MLKALETLGNTLNDSEWKSNYESIEPLANVVLGWGESPDEAWRMACGRW